MCVSGFLTYPIFSNDHNVFIGIPKNEILLAFQKMKFYHMQPTLFMAIYFIGFATFAVIFFISSLNTGPNRPLFIIYFGQITYILCFLLNKGK